MVRINDDKLKKHFAKITDDEIKINQKFKSQLKNNLLREEGYMATKSKFKLNKPAIALASLVLLIIGTIGVVNWNSSDDTPLASRSSFELPGDLSEVITIAEVQDIALLGTEGVSIVGIELEYEDGDLVYKVKLSNGQILVLDAFSGLQKSIQTFEPGDKIDDVIPEGFVAGISLTQAREIAQNQRPDKPGHP